MLTDNEIIKALKCCNEMENMDCLQCPYYSVPYDSDRCSKRAQDTIDLINRQKAEIEMLKNLLKKTKPKPDLAKETETLIEKLSLAICDIVHIEVSNHRQQLGTDPVFYFSNEKLHKIYNTAEKTIRKILKNVTEG